MSTNHSREHIYVDANAGTQTPLEEPLPLDLEPDITKTVHTSNLPDEHLMPTENETRENQTVQEENNEEPIIIPQQSHDPPPEANPGDLQWPIALRKGKRSCTRHPIGRYVFYDRLNPQFKTFVTTVDREMIPRSFEEAMTDENWKLAIEDELRALAKNKTWDIVNIPCGKSKVGCKWVFTK